MRQKIVGFFELGNEQVQVVLREGVGGEFWLEPGDIKCPRIKIGADQACWGDLVAVLDHEALEFTLTRMRRRYFTSMDYANDHGAYTFFLTHVEFAEVAARVAHFLVKCLPQMEKEWRKWRRKKSP